MNETFKHTLETNASQLVPHANSYNMQLVPSQYKILLFADILQLSHPKWYRNRTFHLVFGASRLVPLETTKTIYFPEIVSGEVIAIDDMLSMRS